MSSTSRPLWGSAAAASCTRSMMSLRIEPGRGPRPGGRVGQRQVDGRLTAAAHARADRRARSASRARTITHTSRRPMRRLRRACTWSSRTVLVARPADDGGEIVVSRCGARLGRGAALDRRGTELFDQVGLAPSCVPLPARAVGRPAPAIAWRGRWWSSRAAGCGRAGVVARRVGAGVDPQPAADQQQRHRLRVPVHRARPRDRRAPLRPCRGDVPRPVVEMGRARDSSPRSEAPVLAGAAVGRVVPDP